MYPRENIKLLCKCQMAIQGVIVGDKTWYKHEGEAVSLRNGVQALETESTDKPGQTTPDLLIGGDQPTTPR